MDIIEHPKLWLPPDHHIGPWDDQRYVKRNAFLYRTARLVNIKKCIMNSIPEHLQDAVKEQIEVDSRRAAANRHEADEAKEMNVDDNQLE